jgi:hypothetical protein
MAQPSTPAQDSRSIFGGAAPSSVNQLSTSTVLTPSSVASSNNTFLMPNSPVKGRLVDGYKPKVTRTLGQRPACLVNASVTYCGNNQIYAFGGFDQYTDEVYNHVLRLDMVSHQWSLVDNYGDIPGVRMGMLTNTNANAAAKLKLIDLQDILPHFTKAINYSSSAAKTNIEPTSPTS